jgi:mannose-1-phosphate guanylyltransferase
VRKRSMTDKGLYAMQFEEIKKHIYALIMAGGGGERFWPKSRQAYPKQLHKIFGDRTMIQETVDRISQLVPREHIIVITNKVQAPLIKKQLRGVPASAIVAEPLGRDTAACIALGAAVVMERDRDGIMLVLPADHVIKDVKKLVANLRDACQVAWERGCLVTLGIKPTSPATGYGYIRKGKRLDCGLKTTFSKVAAFAEKPDGAMARRYLKSGRYFWNSGMFVWRAAVIADALKKQMPDLYRGYERIRRAMASPAREKVVLRVYAGLKKVSIDYGVMEKADNTVVAKADFDWDDVGSWLALERHLPADKNQNVILGESIALDTKRCIIISDEGIVGCLGLEDLIVVKTPDAVLVCHRSALQDLKKIIQKLKSRGEWVRYM